LKNLINPRFYRGFFRLRTYFIATAFVFALASCNEFDSIGLDLIDQPLSVNTTDTISLVTITEAEVPLNTAYNPLTRANETFLLGFHYDPIFGKTRASIYTEVLPAIIPKISIHQDSLVIDSVVLSLSYAGYVGSLLDEQRVRVFELGENIPVGAKLSNKTLAVKNEIQVLNPNFKPNPKDSLRLGTDTVPKHPAHLRIRLNNDFGRNLILGLSTGDITTAPEFRRFLNGFHVTVDELNIANEQQQAGSILYFSRDAYSRLIVYYQNLGAAKVEAPLEIRLHNETAQSYLRFENFDHQFVAPAIAAQLQGDLAMGDSVLFLQSMSNFRVKVQVPHIGSIFQNLPGSDYAINSAKLIVPVDDAYGIEEGGLARFLTLVRENPDSVGHFISIHDAALNVPGYFGGIYDETNKRYVFNITRHLQMIMDDPALNTPIYVRVSGSSQNAQKVALKGPGRQQPMKLEIRYTKINRK
jgi:hypothetical protein